MKVSKVNTVAAAAAVSLALVLAGCGASTSSGSSSEATSSTSSSTSSDIKPDEDDHGDHDHGDHDHGDHGSTAGNAMSAEQDGYTLVLKEKGFGQGSTSEVKFEITDPEGATITDFMVMHEKPMHVVVVSADLEKYWHVHPEMSKDGIWEMNLPLEKSGSYRVVADFMPSDGPALALGETIVVGDASASDVALMESRVSEIEGYTAELVGDTLHEDSAPLKVIITKDGTPVTEVEPYLGSAAHFVAFGEDLSYAHMHPNSDEISSSGEIAFTAPPLGHQMYKGFVQVDVGGSLKTFEFAWKGE